jgi:hypothetical protein
MALAQAVARKQKCQVPLCLEAMLTCVVTSVQTTDPPLVSLRIRANLLVDGIA